jgi:hypothetical protein
VPLRQVSIIFSHLWKLGENKQTKKKKQDLGHETKRGTSRDLEGEGKGTKKRKIGKSN